MTKASANDALETLLELDPEIQHKIFSLLTEGFTQGGIPTENYTHDWVPVNDLAHALVTSQHFKNHLKDILKQIAVVVEPNRFNLGQMRIYLDTSGV